MSSLPVEIHITLLYLCHRARPDTDTRVGREDACLTTLASLRSNGDENNLEVQYEFRALQAERLVEREAARERYGSETLNWRTSMYDYKRLFTTKALLRRLMLGSMAQGLQQVGEDVRVRGFSR